MKIFFVHQWPESYVTKDIEILKRKHEVRVCYFTPFNSLNKKKSDVLFKHKLNVFSALIWFIKSIYELIIGVIWCDVTFSWYGKMHAFFGIFFSKVFRKKSIVVSGGDEVEKGMINDKPWGSCSHPIKKWFVFYVFKNADLILAHSKYNLNSTINNAKADPNKVRLIYHGIDTDLFQPVPGIQRKNLVVSVGNINEENLYRKGLLYFVKSAKYLPEIQYLLIGKFLEPKAVRQIKSIAPSNVRFIDGIYGNDLVKVFCNAKVYVQPSLCESFACSMAEAMLCECIPVVSTLAALPEVVGEAGIYVDNLNPQGIAEKIEQALQHPELKVMARKRIENEFSLKIRTQGMLRAVYELANNGLHPKKC